MNKRTKNHEKVIREALVQIFSLQLRVGASIEDLLNLAHESIHAAGKNLLAESIFQGDSDVHRFGNLLRSWHRESRYLATDGFPKHLNLNGRGSLRTLIKAHYPRAQFEHVLSALKRAGLIKRDKESKWFPTTKHAVFPSLSVELLAHFSEGVARFIETMTRNAESRTKEDVLFERSSRVRKLPISAGPAFRQFVNGQALAFLEAVDDWLEGRVEASKTTRERKCTAGVSAFAFMDDLPKRLSGSQ